MSKNTENYQLYTFTSDNDVADLKLLEPTFDTIDKGLVLDVGESTGSGNNYVLNLGSIALTSANKGISFKFWADKNSTGAVTINGTYRLIKANGSSVTNLKKGAPYTITFNGGTNFFLASGGVDDVNFSASDLLTGKSANDSNGEKVNGTMPNKGAVTASLNCGGSYTIPAGYHNGSGKVTANSLASQTGANATSGDILVDKTAYVNGAKITGTMPNNGAVTTSLNCGGSYTIPKGYHNGSGKVTANSLASQTSANATAGDILKNKTAWVNGSKITGSMPNLTADTQIQHESGNSTKVIPADGAFIGNNTDGVKRMGFRYNGADGYITRNTLFGYPMSDLMNDLGITADKIVAGNTIGGIAGSATIQSLGGKKFYCNIIDVTIPKNTTTYNVNIGFAPTTVILRILTPTGAEANNWIFARSTDIPWLTHAWKNYASSSSSSYTPVTQVESLTNTGFVYRVNQDSSPNSKDKSYKFHIFAVG